MTTPPDPTKAKKDNLTYAGFLVRNFESEEHARQYMLELGWTLERIERQLEMMRGE